MSVISGSDDTRRSASLVCEALCREIASAERFSHVEDAWRALLNVRRMEREMRAEVTSFSAATRSDAS